MKKLVAAHGRLIIDNMEFRWLPGGPHVFAVARIAQAVNCGAIQAEVVSLGKAEVNSAADFGHEYNVKEHAGRLAPLTADVPLLAYRRAEDACLALVDGRQRAARAFMSRDEVKAYVVSEADAVLVGRHPASAEVVQLVRFIKDPALLDVVRAVLHVIGSAPIFTPVLDLLRLYALGTNNDALLAELDRFAGLPGIHEERYKLLDATGLHPVAFDGRVFQDRASGKHANQLSHTAKTGRPSDSWREDQVKACYGYHALRLLAMEDEIRRQTSGLFPAYSSKPALTIADYNDGPGQLHQRRRSSYDTYLKAHWHDMGLMGPHSWEGTKILSEQNGNLYPKFAAIEDNAARITARASTYAGADEMRSAVARWVAQRLAARDSGSLLHFRNDAVARFRLMAKAFVRMRQWRPARVQLLAMERGRTVPAHTQVNRVARWDLDAKATLVDLGDMIAFSEMTGVVATEVWPLHLPYNTLFECAALLHGVQRGSFRITPTAVETLHYRARIEADDIPDDHSPHWKKLLKKFYVYSGLTHDVLHSSLRHIDAVQGMDLFDRQDEPNGREFRKQDLSYFMSRLGRASV